MKLEDEIIQKNFDSEYGKLAVNIIFTYGWLTSFYSKILSKYNLTIQQYNILRILRGQYPNAANIGLLKSRMLDKMSDASRLVDRLNNKKLIQKKFCAEDRRRVNVVITAKGLKLLKKIDLHKNEFEDKLKLLTPSEAQKLNNLLDKMRG